MAFKECWTHRMDKVGTLSSSCKGCTYYLKRSNKRIPSDIRCWQYLSCDEKCKVRALMEVEPERKDVSTELLGRGKKVLVLDDSKTLRNLVKFILDEYEYEVATVGNGREALEKANKWHPDVLICDINLAGSSLSGLDVLQQLSRFKIKCKVIMLSSKADRETVEFCLGNGAVAFIRKPFVNDDLVLKVSQALRSE